MSPSTTPDRRHRNFYRQLEAILHRIDEETSLESVLTTVLAEIGDQVLGEQTGITSGRLYRRDGDDYVVVRSFGARGKGILGERVPARYPLLEQISADRVEYFFPDQDGYDSEIEGRLGVENFAAFYLDPGREYIAAFGIEGDADTNEVMLTLNSLRYAIAHRLKELSFEGQLREARDIQVSLLPKHPPQFSGYEMAGKSIPADEVGGDIFDYLDLGSEHLMGVAIGDASGHGLPAALQARDVVTGLRMGVEKDLKVTAVMRRLNSVIHRSGLTSRFISLFYCEIERSGNVVYVNAGHDPVLLLRRGGGHELLGSTGMVMGPLENVQYRRDIIRMEEGDVLVLYTDGMVERLDPASHEEYGLTRLQESARRHLESGSTMSELVDRILQDVHAWGQGTSWADDATVVCVRRLD